MEPAEGLGKGKGVGKSSAKHPLVTPTPLEKVADPTTELQGTSVDKHSMEVDAAADIFGQVENCWSCQGETY